MSNYNVNVCPLCVRQCSESKGRLGERLGVYLQFSFPVSYWGEEQCAQAAGSELRLNSKQTQCFIPRSFDANDLEWIVLHESAFPRGV